MNETVIDGWGDASEVAEKLAGSWSFNRVIEGQGTMQGVAIVTPSDKGGLAYREQGNLKLLNGTELQAEREYIFSKSDRGFEVFFNENPPRLFHDISLSATVGGDLSGSAVHLCNLDNYQSTYNFLPDGRFVVRHVVSGPRKGYTMTTTYTRVARRSGPTAQR
ncbi:hypothetical protein AYJ54_06380 [Bradyrhizobium centrolobii]|uniref:DUF6314 domain-containing protein n=1 Tax=Bradyrhizobium centrolobii TaxID=1505087 RepID=A0A176YZX3_9BRAD|nr:DUF6314 family protein [Bradyrhizobium centrolobii]OAF12450.1 hypothetical protein AYJ54_06380 [Bradyrhizobium centrolobii]